jgi:methyltransferase-like protein 6
MSTWWTYSPNVGAMQRAFYFSNEYLVDLFSKCGFTLEEICVHNKKVENRSLDLVMNR